MTLSRTALARGRGWQADAVVCRAGPRDRAVHEQHDRMCMAIVLDGTFGYRSSRGSATLAPGAILLGNAGDCFCCGHEHSIGDRCLSFRFEEDFFEGVLSAVPGARDAALRRPALPPGTRDDLAIGAEAAFDDPGALEELAIDLASAVVAATNDAPLEDRRGVRTKRIEELAQWIESEPEHPFQLELLARQAAMSRFHLLREFKREMGITPYQFVLSLRLRRAARALRQTRDAILAIALDCGFSDLSEFNRRFRRVVGLTPGDYRRRAARASAGAATRRHVFRKPAA